MAVSGYRFAGSFLHAVGSGFDSQLKNMGMLELDLDKLVPGGKTSLILSLVSFDVPGRKLGHATNHFLAGSAHHQTRPEPQGDITMTVRDYPLLGTRGIVERWYQKCYDEKTGLQLPSSLLKINGHLVLFQTNATSERTARLRGLLLGGRPDVAVDFADGASMLMALTLKCDAVEWEPSLFNPSAA